MPENMRFTLEDNPYECPQLNIDRETQPWPLRRLILAIGISIMVLLFAVLLYSVVSWVTVATVVLLAVIVLGVIPQGYGKYDWWLGLWIIFLCAVYGLSVGLRELESVNRLDRWYWLRLHVQREGLVSGVVAASVYTLVRSVCNKFFRTEVVIRSGKELDGDIQAENNPK